MFLTFIILIYKLLAVYYYLSGGLDSYNMLAPHTCDGDVNDTVYDRYRTIRGKNAISEGLGLPLSRLREIQADSTSQPCSSFGIHEDLPVMKQLYDQKDLLFIANAGLLPKPLNVSNYREGTAGVWLFAHNGMRSETEREDVHDEFAGTGKALKSVVFRTLNTMLKLRSLMYATSSRYKTQGLVEELPM